MLTAKFQVNSTRFAIKSGRLSFIIEDEGSLRWTFELQTKEKGSAYNPSLDMNGYLPMPKVLGKGEKLRHVLSPEESGDLLFYQHDHLPFEQATVVLTSLGKRRYLLEVKGNVHDPRGSSSKKHLKISTRSVLVLHQVGVPQGGKRVAMAALEASGLGKECKAFHWKKMSNGIGTLLSAQELSKRT